jgi:hypothetical protein
MRLPGEDSVPKPCLLVYGAGMPAHEMIDVTDLSADEFRRVLKMREGDSYYGAGYADWRIAVNQTRSDQRP